jgi:hypothetical protein
MQCMFICICSAVCFSCLLTANVVTSSLILFTMMMEAVCPPEMPFLTKSAWPPIPEDSILHSHCHENLKSYIAFITWAL